MLEVEIQAREKATAMARIEHLAEELDLHDDERRYYLEMLLLKQTEQN